MTTKTLRNVVRLPGSGYTTSLSIAGHCTRAPGLETAGLLYLGMAGTVVATGPGPKARLAPDRCEWDAEFIARRCASGRTIIGRWHKHTSPIILASDTDRESAAAFLEATGLPSMLDLIVACDADDEPIGWALYVCTPDGYERAELVWED